MTTSLYLLVQAANVAQNPEISWNSVILELFKLGPVFVVLCIGMYILYQNFKDKDALLIKQTEEALKLVTECKEALASFNKNQENLTTILMKILDKINEMDQKISRIEDWLRNLFIERDRGDTQKYPKP